MPSSDCCLFSFVAERLTQSEQRSEVPAPAGLLGFDTLVRAVAIALGRLDRRVARVYVLSGDDIWVYPSSPHPFAVSMVYGGSTVNMYRNGIRAPGLRIDPADPEPAGLRQGKVLCISTRGVEALDGNALQPRPAERPSQPLLLIPYKYSAGEAGGTPTAALPLGPRSMLSPAALIDTLLRMSPRKESATSGGAGPGPSSLALAKAKQRPPPRYVVCSLCL